MINGKLRNSLIVAVAASLACILQIVGLIRYLDRLPEDYVGIGLYGAAILAFAVTALGFFIRWRRYTISG